MSPHTRLIPLLAGVVLLSSCGRPPRELPESPPLYVSPSAAPLTLPPSLGLPTVGQTPPLPGATGLPGVPGVPGQPYPTYPYPTVRRTTLGPETIPATSRPSPAPRCAGSPTNAQILDLLKQQPGVPKTTLKVVDGPYCATDWSFSAVEVSGTAADQVEPLLVVTQGKDATLRIVAAGSEVCIAPVEKTAPPGIKVLACGE